MAHSCPECGEACYCGGYIYDIFDCDPAAEQGCTHCSDAGFDHDDEGDYDVDEQDESDEAAYLVCL